MKEKLLDIAASLFMLPCTEDELSKRDFLKNTSYTGISFMLWELEKRGAIYYRPNSEKIFIYKKWARDNLQDHELFILCIKKKSW